MKKHNYQKISISDESVSPYNLEGKSYSNNFQTEISFIPFPKFDVRFTYRVFDVKTTYGNLLLPEPLISKNRAFANIGYKVHGWKFDYTITCNCKKRLPPTTDDPPQYQRSDYSPSFVMMNAQISKTIGKKNPFEIYDGGENLTNYIQKNAIADQPFSNYFDALLIWGSVTERMVYVENNQWLSKRPGEHMEMRNSQLLKIAG